MRSVSNRFFAWLDLLARQAEVQDFNLILQLLSIFTRVSLQSPERLKTMNYHDKVEQASSRINAKFIDYRPDTGSWVFEVS